MGTTLGYIEKLDKSLRMCLDSIALNIFLIKETVQIFTFDEMKNKLKVFCSVWPTHCGFYQCELETDSKKIVFSAHYLVHISWSDYSLV